MLTSGMTGYVPNKSDSAVADAWDVPFVSIGDPHMDDESNASFNSQISKIFNVVGKDNLFIAMADRWLPGYHVDARISDLFTRVIASSYAPEQYQASSEERKEMYEAILFGLRETALLLHLSALPAKPGLFHLFHPPYVRGKMQSPLHPSGGSGGGSLGAYQDRHILCYLL